MLRKNKVAATTEARISYGAMMANLSISRLLIRRICRAGIRTGAKAGGLSSNYTNYTNKETWRCE